jgi:CRISPR-associated protein Cas5d
LLEVKVWGDYACFTRPEHKVERVSYDVMTPSAARGILEAISWKPEFRWRVREIWVLNPIRHFSLVRNEVKSLASARSARSWEASDGGFFADQDRTQRFALVLRDVAYRIRADIELLPHATDPVAKYREIFRRRVEKGQAHARPYLGNREFSAYFAPPDDTDIPQDLTDDLGRMLFDLAFTTEKQGPVRYRRHGADGATWVEGRASPIFFSARLDRGVLHVPQSLYESAP